MENKEQYHNWTIFEHLNNISEYESECLITKGEYMAIGLYDCGELVEINEVELIPK